MQMRITILDFVSFCSMTWKVKISQAQESLAGSSVSVCRLPAPHGEQVLEVSWHSEEC